MYIPMQIVWSRYKQPPIITYCRRCDTVAACYYSEDQALHCDVCRSTRLSIFIWDQRSPLPGAVPESEYEADLPADYALPAPREPTTV